MENVIIVLVMILSFFSALFIISAVYWLFMLLTGHHVKWSDM